MSAYKEKIALRKIRNFSETIAAASYFIKQNLSILLKSTAFIAMPIVMIGFLGIGLASLGLIEGTTNDNVEGLMTAVGTFYIAMFVMSLGLVLVMGCVYEYIVLYEKKDIFQNITVADISKNVFRHIGLYIGTTFLLAISFGVILFFAILFFGMFVVVHKIFIFFSVVGIIFSFLYMAIALSNIYMVRIVEKCSFFDAFGRCFELLQGFFLSTLGLYFVTSLISFSLLGLLPMIIQGVSLFFAETLMFDVPILFYALQIFYGFFYIGYNIIYGVVISFRYFSLVETKEGIGMLEKIEQIGQHLQIAESKLNGETL